MPPLKSTVLSTLQDIKDAKHFIYGHCGNFPRCSHAKILDIDGLIHRLGPTYEFVGNDKLQKSLVCDVCKHKGGTITLHGPDRGKAPGRG
jgi:hypothetical protein